jgi:hypothetical protein
MMLVGQCLLYATLYALMFLAWNVLAFAGLHPLSRGK